MFFFFLKLFFIFELLLKKVPILRGKKNGEMKEKLKKKQKRNENEKERRSLSRF